MESTAPRTTPLATLHEGPDYDVGRRALVGALFGFGAVALAGCAAETDSGTSPGVFGQTSLALSGANVGWADAITDLRAMPATPVYAVVIAKGYYTPGDGGGGEFHWTNDTVTADDGGIVIVPTAVPRTGCWKRIVNGFVSVKWFGAKGDETGDDAPAINSAIAATNLYPASPLGWIVYFPPGKYRTTQPIYIRKGGVSLIGCGAASAIVPVGAFSTIILADLLGNYLYRNRIMDLYFLEDGKTVAGYTIEAIKVAEFTIDRVTGESGRGGVSIDTFNSIWISRLRLVNYKGSTNGFPTQYVALAATFGPNYHSDAAWLDHCYFGGAVPANIMHGILVTGSVHTVNFSKVGISNTSAKGLYVKVGGTASEYPAFVTANDLEIEFCQDECIFLDKCENCSFGGTIVHGSKAKNNIYIGPNAVNLDFTGGSSSGAWLSGMAADGKTVTVTSMRFHTNNQNNPATGVYPGILVGGSSTGVVVTGCRSGWQPATGLPHQRYGCQIDTGAANFCVVGNVFTNNRDGAIINGAGTSSSKIVDHNAG
jgi:hypothetical protein